MGNFKKNIKLHVEDRIIFDALTNSISDWWTEMFEGNATNEGDIFTVRFGSSTFKTFIVEEIIPFKKIVWCVVDTLIDIPELSNKREWLNTQIVWEISSHGNESILDLTHIGLTPEIECYKICATGWDSFLNSLSQFIETGIGKPYKKG